jgi:hypothetical protein
MSKTTLTAKEVETLVKLNSKCKEAKKNLDEAKAELLPNSIAEGKYIAKIGCVQKVGIVQTVIDYKRLIEDHPEINLKKYTTYKDAPRILITDFRDADESFIAKLLH